VTPRAGRAGWVPAGSLARRSKPHRSALGEQDALRSQEAQRIQNSHRSWLVMWSVWRRTFTAFSCFSPHPLVVDKPTADGLVSEMRRIELHYSPTPIDVQKGVRS
jgi:hypothetical protein